MIFRLCMVFLAWSVSAQTFGFAASIPDIPESNTRVRRQSDGSQTCKYTQTLVNGKNICPNTLIFSEEFDELNAKRWQSEIKFADTPDFEFVLYGNDSKNLYAGNSQLHIKPTLTEHKFGKGFVTNKKGLDLGSNCTGIPDSLECKQKPVAHHILPPVFSARINSKPSFSFLYGRIEIRAKLPKGDWIYPELFLTPTKSEYGNENYESGEIRIAFVGGNANFSKQLKGGAILGQDEKSREFGQRTSESKTRYNDNFHTYSVMWEPNGLTLLVDDQVYGTVIPGPKGFGSDIYLSSPTAHSRWSTGGKMAPLDKEMFITVGVGVGGSSFPDSYSYSKPYNNIDGKGRIMFHRAKDMWLPTWSVESELIVDYIKVYSLDSKKKNRCSICRIEF